MKKELINNPEIKLIGLSIRTNNKNEMKPQTSKIGELVQHYFSQNISALIPDRKGPIFSVYTDYDSDEHGDYSYFIGEEVNALNDVPNGLEKLIIPAAKYQKFTTPSGKMPDVVIAAWQQIWKMSAKELGGKRTYQTDFQIHDNRARDPENTILDIYVGIE